MKAGWLIGFAILRSTGYWVWDIWKIMDCSVMWQELSRWNSSKACYREECENAHTPLNMRFRILNQKEYQDGTTARPVIKKNLEMRVYRSIYLFKFLIKKNDCDKEWLWRNLLWEHNDVKEGVMSWFQPIFSIRDPIEPSAAWHCLHIRLHNIYYLFIIIISFISKYKHSASFRFLIKRIDYCYLLFIKFIISFIYNYLNFIIIANTRIKWMFHLYKFLILSIMMKCEKSKKLSIRLRIKKTFNIKSNELIKTMNIINKYQMKIF